MNSRNEVCTCQVLAMDNCHFFQSIDSSVRHSEVGAATLPGLRNRDLVQLSSVCLMVLFSLVGELCKYLVAGVSD